MVSQRQSQLAAKQQCKHCTLQRTTCSNARRSSAPLRMARLPCVSVLGSGQADALIDICLPRPCSSCG